MEAHSTNIVMAVRLTIALFLLLSLCVSRGEGIHLMPFAQGSEPASAEKASADRLDRSISHQEGFHSKPLQKIGKEGRDSDGRRATSEYAVNVASPLFDDRLDQDIVFFKPEKGILASGSDRSPPQPA